MKIKLLKDLPGYKAGEVFESETNKIVYPKVSNTESLNTVFEYRLTSLINSGYAEEIKDDIDIEEIRKSFQPNWKTSNYVPNETIEEIDWFAAYRIVKAVIEKLNGEWRHNWKDYKKNFSKFENYDIFFNHIENRFEPERWNQNQHSILPYCKDIETAQKIIVLCEPELKVLFGVK